MSKPETVIRYREAFKRQVVGELGDGTGCCFFQVY